MDIHAPERIVNNDYHYRFTAITSNRNPKPSGYFLEPLRVPYPHGHNHHRSIGLTPAPKRSLQQLWYWCQRNRTPTNNQCHTCASVCTRSGLCTDCGWSGYRPNQAVIEFKAKRNMEDLSLQYFPRLTKRRLLGIPNMVSCSGPLVAAKVFNRELETTCANILEHSGEMSA